jgi:hypothetical protein
MDSSHRASYPLGFLLSGCQNVKHIEHISLYSLLTHLFELQEAFSVLCMYGKLLDSGIPKTDIMLQFHKQDHFFIQGHFTSWAILSSRMPFEQVLYNLVLFSSCTPTTEIFKN